MDLTSQGLPLPSSTTFAPGTTQKRTLASELWSLSKTFLRVFGVFAATGLSIALWQYPYETGAVGLRHIERPANYAEFYGRIYKAPDPNGPAVKEEQNDPYVIMAKRAIENDRIVPRMQAFVAQYGLQKAHVLDVGSGTGYLQDVVPDYVGLDISSTAVRYYHKPFVEASATEMPLPDNEFDAAWSIWVLEHVPNPEQALSEIRRVVKDGGLLYMNPAWNATSYAAEGYPVRPYSDLNFVGMFHKTAWMMQLISPFPQLIQSFTRAGLFAQSWGGVPARLHYRSITPNYDHYWMPDSDAINRLDRYEMSLWFTSRGDECLNCSDRFTNVADELVIRVHKK